MARFLASILLLIAALSPAIAGEIPAACTGKNLLEEMQRTNPDEAAAILKEMQAEPNQGPLLWKIEAPGKKKPSWLIGTMHVTDTRVATLNESIKTKIAKARVVVLELKEIGNKQELAAKLRSFTTALQMPDGKSIWDVIPDEQENIIRSNPAIAMLPASQIEHMQPWVLAQSLALPFCEQLRQPFKKSLDEALAQHAEASSVPVEGLETPAEQIRVLSSIAMSDQVEGLIAQAKRKVSAEDIYITMVDLYLSRQVSAFFPLMKRLPEMKDQIQGKAAEKFMFDLIEKRNIIMAERARKYLNKGNAVIGVGSAHLPGKMGVVELLRQAGYKITPAE